jgi:hypothetical protein
MRNEAADRSGVVGSVDGVVATGQCQRGRAHGIARRSAGNDDVRQSWISARHVGWRLPGRPDVLAVDDRAPRPLLPGASDTNRIAQRTPVAEHEVEFALAGAHHDGAGRGVAVEGDRLARRRRLNGRKQTEQRARKHGGDGSIRSTHDATS